MSKPKTSAVAHGGIALAVYMILLFVFLYVPLLYLITIFILPLPFTLHTYRFGLKSGLMAGLAALLLHFMLAPLPTIFVTLLAVSVGTTMGTFYVRQKGSFAPILAGTLACLGNYLFMIVVLNVLFDTNVISMIQSTSTDMIQQMKAMMSELQIPIDDQQIQFFDQYTQWIGSIFPALMIISSAAMAGLHHVLGRPLLSRMGVQIERLPPLRDWRLPKSLLAYYIITLGLILFGFAQEGNALFLIVANLHPILEILLYIQGLSVIAYYSYQKNMGRTLPVIAVILTFLLAPWVTPLIRIIGIFELGIGLRKIMKSKE